jgi:hypothetical protein
MNENSERGYTVRENAPVYYTKDMDGKMNTALLIELRLYTYVYIHNRRYRRQRWLFFHQSSNG